MTGLGVLGDQPADPYQAPLADGIHLRWGFKRELGFPWYGFYLFRRPSRPGGTFCLSAVTGGLKAGDSPGSKHYTAIGVLSSDTGLVLTEEFAPSDRVEFALDGRKFLRFDLPEGEPARRVELSIGFRRTCLNVAQFIPPPGFMQTGKSLMLLTPLTAQGVTLDSLTLTGGAQFDIVNTLSGPLVGLLCGQGRMALKLPAPTREVELLLTRLDGTPTVEAFNGKGQSVAKVLVQGTANQPQTVRLRGENIVRVDVSQNTKSTYLHRVCADVIGGGAEGKSEIKATAYSGSTPVRSVSVSGQVGKVVSATLEADAITSVEIAGGAAALVDLCYAPVALDATKGWERLSDFTYPLGLPVTQPDYPCSVAAPQTLLAQRVRHPWPPGWHTSAFTELHDQLKELVRGGPSTAPMIDRLFAAPQAQASPQDPTPPQLSKFYLLDMVLLAALHPALAQAVGLYWVDRTAKRGAAYDYLLVADYTGVGQRDPAQVLSVIQSSGFAQLDGYIVFNKRVAAEPPLAPPSGLEAYELPGGTFPDAQGQLPQSSNNAGLRWQVGRDDSGALLPESAVMYLVWRAGLGNAAAAAANGAYNLITKLPPNDPMPVMVGESRTPNGLVPQRPPDWPQVPLHYIDRNLKDGWYGYRLTGIDIYGRHSAQGPPVKLRVLDKIPPTSPTGVEAYALDPEDPYLQRGDAYDVWYDALAPSVRQTLVGLRVRWRWTVAHTRQNPDVREFRIYFHPGPLLPADHGKGVNWQERYFVAPYASGFKLDPQTGDRVYELFLPPAGSANLASIPLSPTLAEPVVYAHVGVSAADDKQHAPDLRVGGQWGNRFGNEGRVMSAKIYRVLREPPPAPESVLGGERLYASPADYHGRSFFTFRWKPQPHLKLHVFRALDDGLFQADWSQRQLNALTLDATQVGLFPPGWNAATRQNVADEINHLNTFVGIKDGTGEAQAFAYYRGLSDAALRVLAGLPTSDDAFVQLTINPLVPSDTTNADRKGPDTPDDFIADPNHRAFIDALDGRAANRYFYRAAYADGAHNLGPLGPPSPPVYLPKVVPPLKPVLIGIRGGERQIELRWLRSREADVATYRVYRAGAPDATRDIRLMELAQTLQVADLDPNENEVSWIDLDLPAGADFYYRVTALDSESAPNESPPSKAVVGRAVDTAPPQPPEWLSAEWVIYDTETKDAQPWPESGVVPSPYRAAVRLELQTASDLCSIYRRFEGEKAWHLLPTSATPAAGVHVVFDLGAKPEQKASYRAVASNHLGATSSFTPAVVVEEKWGAADE